MNQCVGWAACGAALLVAAHLGLTRRAMRSPVASTSRRMAQRGGIAGGPSPIGSQASSWSWWRTLWFAAGCLLFVAAVRASPGALAGRREAAWIGGASIGVVTSMVPVLLVLGSPVASWRAAVRRPRPPSGRAWLGWLRWVFHPLVAGPINCIVLIMVFTSGWYERAQSGGVSWLALLLVVLAGGLLTDVGLLVRGVLPGMSPGMRVLWSGVDALFDEVPGVVVMAVQSTAVGGAMWAVAQPVVLPLLAVLLVRWLRHDRELARRTDAELDEAERRRREEIASALRWFSREEQQRGQ